MVKKRSKKVTAAVEFGDFQTPITLAGAVCQILARYGVSPASILEPTCGVGNLLAAAIQHFPDTARAVGVEINPRHVEKAMLAIQLNERRASDYIIRGDFFKIDWASILRDLPDPLLVLGNPPWVTNSELGVLDSSNVPYKSNFQNHNGLDAVTGKSNFDISESMLIRLLEHTAARDATIAMICKTTVARKVLAYIWRNAIGIERAQMHLINAAEHFKASVDACFLVFRMSPTAHVADCSVISNGSATDPTLTFGFRDGSLLADVQSYERWKHLQGCNGYKWRSGVKHDCARIMELRQQESHYRNGLREIVEIEDDYLFPALKSSDLVHNRGLRPRLRMLVTQRVVGEDTHCIQETAPKTWNYLLGHADLLDRRSSSIYKNRPRFSVFGVGPYSFAQWKVAISGFYKQLVFEVVGNIDGKPTMLDDTCYFVPCQSESEAYYIAAALNSTIAKQFFECFVFWDAKRPITVELLNRLDWLLLARELGTEPTMAEFLSAQLREFQKRRVSDSTQFELFAP